MNRYGISALLFVLLLAGCAGVSKKGGGMILLTSNIYSKPDSASDEKIRVNRGESVAVEEEKKTSDSKSWLKVKLSDEETTGWIRKKYVHIGSKEPITLTQKTSLRVRPDDQSRSIKTLQRGTSMYILKTKGDWKRVSIEYNKTGWIKTKNYVKGIKKKEN